MRRILHITGFVIVIGTIYAQTNVPSRLTLEQALQHATRRNGEFLALQRDWHSARKRVQMARAPQPIVLLWTPVLSTGGAGEELIASQMLELNGARPARTRTAEAEQRVAHAQILETANTLLTEVATAFYHALYAERLRQFAEMEVQRAQQTLNLIRQQVEIGVRPGIDQIQAEIELERVRQKLHQRTSEARNASAVLNRWLGLPADTSLDLIEERVPTPPPSQADWRNNPEWRLQQARLAYPSRVAQQVRVEGLPDMGVQMRIERWAGARTRPGFGLIFSFPFLDYGARRSHLQAIKASIEAETDRTRETERRLAIALENAHRQVNTAYQRWLGYQQDILPRVESLLRSAQIGLESGQLSILQVLEAQRTARITKEEALITERDYWLACVAYARASAQYLDFWNPISQEESSHE